MCQYGEAYPLGGLYKFCTARQKAAKTEKKNVAIAIYRKKK